ncbi:MAG: helix-turn-helix transcriptional regulator [Acidobacteriota bacterium]
MEIDNNSIGLRIRRIRKEAKLRQRELAALLGTTQSAIHKYEHGIIPEPRRLLKLADIGHTSIEWILTGTHWENGSTGKERLTPDILALAKAFNNLDDEKRKVYRDAIDILEEAVRAIENKLKQKLEDADALKIAEVIKTLPKDLLEVLSVSSEIHRAIEKKIFSKQKSKLSKIRS